MSGFLLKKKPSWLCHTSIVHMRLMSGTRRSPSYKHSGFLGSPRHNYYYNINPFFFINDYIIIIDCPVILLIEWQINIHSFIHARQGLSPPNVELFLPNYTLDCEKDTTQQTALFQLLYLTLHVLFPTHEKPRQVFIKHVLNWKPTFICHL